MPYAISKKAFEGDSYCGDECAAWEQDGHVILCVVDGLGHGREAELASSEAVRYIAQHLDQPLDDLFAGCNAALRETRGAALGLIVIDLKDHTLTYAGIGNTRALVVNSRKVIRFSSNYGIIGGGYRRLTPETVPFTFDNMVILYTDGVQEMIDLSIYPDELMKKPHALCQKIIKDWGIPSDDAAVLIYTANPDEKGSIHEKQK